MINRERIQSIAKARAGLEDVRKALAKVLGVLDDIEARERNAAEAEDPVGDSCDEDDGDGEESRELFQDVDQLTRLLNRELGIPSTIIGTVLVYANDVMSESGGQVKAGALVHQVSSRTGVTVCMVCEILRNALEKAMEGKS